MPRQMRPETPALCTPVEKHSIESRLKRAYIRLFIVPEGENGSRTISLERIGRYEVRLVEISSANSADRPPLWVELYAHDLQNAVDSCSCHELEEAVAAAEHLISQAKQLNEEAARTGMVDNPDGLDPKLPQRPIVSVTSMATRPLRGDR